MTTFSGLACPAILTTAYALSASLTGGAPADERLEFLAAPRLAPFDSRNLTDARETAFSGAICPSYADALYDRVVVIPCRVAAGYVGSDMQYDVEIWNTQLAASTLLTVAVDPDDGLAFDALGGDVFSIWGSRFYVLDVFARYGPASLDSGIALAFSGDLDLILAVTCTRLAVWPFKALAPHVEVLEWLTDVLTARSGVEDRRRLRTGPRVTLEMDYALLTQASRSMFEALSLLSQDRTCGVPWWPGQRPCGDVAPGAETVACDTADAGFEDGGTAIIWQDADTWETVEVTDIASDALTLSRPVTAGYSRALVIPMRRCRMALAFTRTDLPAGSSMGHAEFTQLLPETPDEGAAEETWAGSEVFPQRLWCGGSGVRREGSRGAEELDADTGGVFRVVHADAAVTATPLLLSAKTRDECVALRQFLHRLAGRHVPFRLPTGRADMALATDADAGALTLRVANASAVMACNSPVRRALSILLPDGSTIRREVSGAAPGPGDTEDLTVTEVLPAMSAGSVRISWLMLARLDSDRVEIAWERTTRCTVKTQALEVIQ